MPAVPRFARKITTPRRPDGQDESKSSHRTQRTPFTTVIVGMVMLVIAISASPRPDDASVRQDDALPSQDDPPTAIDVTVEALPRPVPAIEPVVPALVPKPDDPRLQRLGEAEALLIHERPWARARALAAQVAADAEPPTPVATSQSATTTPAPTASAPPQSVRVAAAAPGAAGTVYVSTSGNDRNPGSVERPLRTVSAGMEAVRAGQTLYIRGGTYREDVLADLSHSTRSQPILVSAYPGERPVIQGMVSIREPHYVTLNGFNVTWHAGAYDEHMFKINDGVGWTLQNSEIWGARSFANVLVAGGEGWVIRGNVIHDTHGGESDTNRSHNLYVNGARNGVIERNLIFNAPHGYNIKLGGSSGGTEGSVGVIVRYNTLSTSGDRANMLVANASSGNVVERNIFSSAPDYSSVHLWDLNGSGNVVRNNLGHGAPTFCVATSSSVSCAQTDGGGNIFGVDPQLDPGGGFRPLNAAASAYGRHAP